MASDTGNKVTQTEALQKMAQRVAKGEKVLLTPEEHLGFLRLAHELGLYQIELDRLNDEIKVRDEELNRLKHDFWTGQRDLFDYLNFIPVAFIALDKKGVVQRANETGRSLLNTNVRPLLGSLFSTYIKPEDHGVYFKKFKSLTRRHPTTACELRLFNGDGREILTHVQVEAKFERPGGFSGWYLAIVDVTETHRRNRQLKLVHEQLEMASQAAEMGVWNYDLDNQMTVWNAQLYRLLGLEPRPGPEDAERFFDFIHPEDRKGIVADLDAILNSSEDNIDEEFRVVRADGKTRWLAARGRIYRDERGRPARISGINFDITERKKAEERFRLTQLRLVAQLAETQRVNEELSQYAYVVSHDLKAPLRAIRNYADFLYEDLAGSLTGEQKRYLEGMKKAVAEGDALINDLFSLSRIGGIELETKEVDVSEILDEILYRLQPLPEVTITIEPEWPQLRLDRTLLKQILENLISNSIKFNESAIKRIEIGWQSPDGNIIDIYVRDNGIGIDPQYRQKIFRIFHRLHTARHYEGTGIGLAIVQKAAAKLGGSVRLDSEPGKGSTFYVQLPRQAETTEPKDVN